MFHAICVAKYLFFIIHPYFPRKMLQTWQRILLQHVLLFADVFILTTAEKDISVKSVNLKGDLVTLRT